MLPLRESTLPHLARRVVVPSYDRTALRSAVVHIGVGGFHRAHQAIYLDDLARSGVTGWGEVGVSLRSRGLKDALAQQDGLFSVVEMGEEGAHARVVGAMTDYLFGPADPQAVVDRLAHPDVRLVTLTVTGDGYLTAGEPPVSAEGASSNWAGYLVAALAKRRAGGLGGLTVLSCDNLADNGRAARATVLAAADVRDETLARWIDHNVTFPNSMVDRITPGSDDRLRQLMMREFRLRDRAPVATEPFRQWFIEDDFSRGRPPFEDVGVQMVGNVTPYRLVKTRLLNGTHTAIAYLGLLAGHRTTAELIADPTMRAFAEELMRHEVAPLLPPLPELSISEYVDSVLDRLANHAVADPLTRLARRGSTKVPAYLLPSLVEATRRGGRPAMLSLAVAGWLRYVRGTDLQGRPIEVEDARRAELRRAARGDGRDVLAALTFSDGIRTAAEDPRIRSQVASALADLEHGVVPAIQRRLTRAARTDFSLSLTSSAPTERTSGLTS